MRRGKSFDHPRECRLGPIGPEELRPADRLGQVGCPVFVASGKMDPLTTEDDTRYLFASAPVPRELWLVPGAGHEDRLRYSPNDYRRRVLAFLSRHVGVPSPLEVDVLAGES